MRSILIVLILCIDFQGVAVFAQEKNIKDAKAYFQKGKSQFKQELYSDAAASFRKAYDFSPNWKIQYNLAQSEAAAKRHGLALNAFELYLALGGDDIVESRRQEVQQEIARLKKMVGYLEINAPEGAKIIIDNVERGTAPIAGVLPVSGSVIHIVQIVKSDGKTLPEKKVSLVSGKQTKLVFEEEEKPKTTPAVVSPLEEKDQGPVTVEPGNTQTEEEDGPVKPLALAGWITVGIGTAVLIAGGITGGLALSANSEVEEKCPNGCYDTEYDLMMKRDTLGVTTNVLLSVGGVVTAAGGAGLLIYRAIKSTDESREDRAFLFSPIISKQAAGVAVDLRF